MKKKLDAVDPRFLLEYLTRGASSPGSGVASRIIMRSVLQGERLEAAAHRCGLLRPQLVGLFYGTRPLAKLSLRTLGSIAAYLELEPALLAIAAGHLRESDFAFPGTPPAIEPYAGEWAAWLHSNRVAAWREWARVFGLADDGVPEHLPGVAAPLAAGGPPDYLSTWVAETLRQRGEPVEVVSTQLGLDRTELGRFLTGGVDPQGYTRAQLACFAAFLGVPGVAVLAAIDALERPAGKSVGGQPTDEPPGRSQGQN